MKVRSLLKYLSFFLVMAATTACSTDIEVSGELEFTKAGKAFLNDKNELSLALEDGTLNLKPGSIKLELTSNGYKVWTDGDKNGKGQKLSLTNIDSTLKTPLRPLKRLSKDDQQEALEEAIEKAQKLTPQALLFLQMATSYQNFSDDQYFKELKGVTIRYSIGGDNDNSGFELRSQISSISPLNSVILSVNNVACNAYCPREMPAENGKKVTVKLKCNGTQEVKDVQMTRSFDITSEVVDTETNEIVATIKGQGVGKDPKVQKIAEKCIPK